MHRNHNATKMWDAKTLTNIQLSLPHIIRNSNQTKELK